MPCGTIVGCPVHLLKDEVLRDYNPSEVAILAPEHGLLDGVGAGLSVGCYGSEGKKPKEIAKNLARWKNNECVWKSTTHAFKGLEAMAIVHLVPPGYDQKRLLYVGGSRATHQLYLVTVNAVLRESVNV